jgi:hypothetical protein
MPGATSIVCDACEEGFYLDEEMGLCGETCPLGTYENVDVCSACGEGCADCVGPTECYTCHPGYQ